MSEVTKVGLGCLQVRKTTFEGVTGMISFNEVGDRHTNSELWNVPAPSARQNLRHCCLLNQNIP